MTVNNKHKYVAVLGSCCTCDAIGATSFEDVATTKLRLLLFQGRTSFFSMSSPGLFPEEFEHTLETRNVPRLDWGVRMATDEVTKNHQRRLAEVIGLTDALVVDNVSAFVFPILSNWAGDRYFLKSWEWEKFILPRIDLRQARLWDLPLDLSVGAARQVLEALYEKRPELSVIFHVPQPSFNDGVGFEDPAVTDHIDFYQEYCDRLCAETMRYFPKVSVVSPPSPRADPMHPNGAHPFRYEKSYLDLVRREIESILNV